MNKKEKRVLNIVIGSCSIIFALLLLFSVFSSFPTGKVTLISPYTLNKTKPIVPSECTDNGGDCILFSNDCSEGYSNANFACNTRSERCCMKENDPSVDIPSNSFLLLNVEDKFVSYCPEIFYLKYNKIWTGETPYIEFKDLVTDKKYKRDYTVFDRISLGGREYAFSILEGNMIQINSTACNLSKLTYSCNSYLQNCFSSIECCSKICQNNGCDSALKKINVSTEMGLWCEDTQSNTPTIKLVYIFNDSTSFINDRVEFVNLISGEIYKTHWIAEGIGSIVVQGKTYVIALLGNYITIQPIISSVCNIHYNSDFVSENIAVGSTKQVGALTITVLNASGPDTSFSSTFSVVGYGEQITLTKTNPSKVINIGGKDYVIYLLYANNLLASFKVTYVILPPSPVCSSTTCSSLGFNCGVWPNGTCAGTLNCGTCGIGYVCLDGVCTISKTKGETSGEEKIQENECDGCLIENMCLPYGYRLNELYCGTGKNLVNQSISGTCDNNFECRSNVCLNGKCASPGLVQRFINWLAKFFRSK